MDLPEAFGAPPRDRPAVLGMLKRFGDALANECRVVEPDRDDGEPPARCCELKLRCTKLFFDAPDPPVRELPNDRVLGVRPDVTPRDEGAPEREGIERLRGELLGAELRTLGEDDRLR